MLRDIEAEVRYTRTMIGKDALDPRVMAAMAEVPRHEFVPGHQQLYAYANGPLPIGHGQTISQPYIVALMTDLVGCGPGDRVLEVGTGSGYQAAVLSRVVGQVYSVEIVPELAEQAAKRLTRLGYTNVETRCGDGYDGWAEHAPYDGILVTAAAPSVPPPLLDQLKEGTRLVIPVGQPFGYQELLLVERSARGTTRTTNVLGVAFVPLTRRGLDSD
ncbi:MAG: protein-L-isoaspartate(D-aspartate) O-methyltransferase [Pseudomonadota bacterium]|nr:protein-L-isoaspartate(D-aspartate) O-methyltransferase [Pseudomonadota bacterium]